MATNLSTLVGGRVPDYIEFGWVCAPNGAGQSITANTVTTLSCDTLVANPSNLDVVAPVSNAFTLPAGTYYYEATVGIHSAAGACSATFSLYNDSTRVSGKGVFLKFYNSTSGVGDAQLNGNLVLTGPSSFTLRILTSIATTVRNGFDTYSNSTPNADQRTTIKLWKLK